MTCIIAGVLGYHADVRILPNRQDIIHECPSRPDLIDPNSWYWCSGDFPPPNVHFNVNGEIPNDEETLATPVKAAFAL